VGLGKGGGYLFGIPGDSSSKLGKVLLVGRGGGGDGLFDIRGHVAGLHCLRVIFCPRGPARDSKILAFVV